jgi:hypothetical protein
MSRLPVATLTVFVMLVARALAQMPETPGPGGIPIAPGAPVPGYTPGGIGVGGVQIAPGPAARDVPMYRIGPGGVVMPPRPDPRPGRDSATARRDPGCGQGGPCVTQSLAQTITSRDAGPGKAPSPDTAIDSIDDLFAALRACWGPPARGEAREGVQVSVRFSFKRTGEMVAPPSPIRRRAPRPRPGRSIVARSMRRSNGACRCASPRRSAPRLSASRSASATSTTVA